MPTLRFQSAAAPPYPHLTPGRANGGAAAEAGDHSFAPTLS
jgi:hypothetical protein